MNNEKVAARLRELANKVENKEISAKGVVKLDILVDEVEKEELKKVNYVPTPFNMEIKDNYSSGKFTDGTKYNIKRQTSNTPFIQIHPILNYRLLNWNKYSFANESSVKLFLYIASIIKRDCNYVYFTREEVNRYTKMNNKTFAASLSSLIKMNVLVPINNVKSCYVINHNYVYNGAKKDLFEWLNAKPEKRKIKFIYEEHRTTPVVHFENVYRDFLKDKIKNITFEPFEGYDFENYDKMFYNQKDE